MKNKKTNMKTWEEKFDEAFGELWSGLKVYGGNEKDKPSEWVVVNKDNVKAFITSLLEEQRKEIRELDVDEILAEDEEQKN